MWDAGAAGCRIDVRGLRKQSDGVKPAVVDPMALKERGNAAIKAGNLPEAARLYTAALAAKPSST